MNLFPFTYIVINFVLIPRRGLVCYGREVKQLAHYLFLKSLLTKDHTHILYHLSCEHF